MLQFILNLLQYIQFRGGKGAPERNAEAVAEDFSVIIFGLAFRVPFLVLTGLQGIDFAPRKHSRTARLERFASTRRPHVPNLGHPLWYSDTI